MAKTEDDRLYYIEYYSIEEMAEELAKVLKVSKRLAARMITEQRRIIKNKLFLGYRVDLPGVVSIVPKERKDGVILVATVAQSVTRPKVVRKRLLSIYDDEEVKGIESKVVEDEDFV